MMTALGRRHFLTLAGAGLVGGSAVLVAGCGGGDSAAPATTAGGGPLDGTSFDIRRDPG